MFPHAFADTPAAWLDRTAERFDIAHACALHRTGFGERKYGRKGQDRNDDDLFEDNRSDFSFQRMLTETI